MRRREFVAAGCCFVGGISAGCLDEDDSEPVPEIVSLEVRNDRREDDHDFLVQIEDEEGIMFEETYHLEAADPVDSVITLEEHVEPGAHTVRVEVNEHSATVDVQDRITADQTCIRLQFYLGPEHLHSEYQLYDRCE